MSVVVVAPVDKGADLHRNQAKRCLDKSKAALAGFIHGSRKSRHRVKARLLESQRNLTRRARLMARAEATVALDVAEQDKKRTRIEYKVKIDVPDSNYRVIVTLLGEMPSSERKELKNEDDEEVGIGNVKWWNDPAHPNILKHVLGLWADHDAIVKFGREGFMPPVPRRDNFDVAAFYESLRGREFSSLCKWASDLSVSLTERRLRLFLLGVGRFQEQRSEFPPVDFQHKLLSRDDKDRKDQKGGEDDNDEGPYSNDDQCEALRTEETRRVADASRRPSFNSSFGFHPILLQSASRDDPFYKHGVTSGPVDPWVSSFESVDEWWYRNARVANGPSGSCPW